MNYHITCPQNGVYRRYERTSTVTILSVRVRLFNGHIACCGCREVWIHSKRSSECRSSSILYESECWLNRNQAAQILLFLKIEGEILKITMKIKLETWHFIGWNRNGRNEKSWNLTRFLWVWGWVLELTTTIAISIWLKILRRVREATTIQLKVFHFFR